ncbi:MAG: hypothetical protein WCI92_11790, partial [Bacteroidota bacterium]
MKSKLLLLLMALLTGIHLQAQIIASNDTTVCYGNPVSLHGELFNGSYGTSSYTFETYTYTPEAYDDPNKVQVLFPSWDDAVAGPYDIGFDFCFFNHTYTQFWVGTNGWISFQGGNSTSYQPLPLPNPGAPRNCIMAPWQDWLPGALTESTVFYYVTGTAPTRKLVVYWNNTGMWACTGTFGKFQIVINELSSVVENHLTEKPYCSFQENRATQGVQNATGDTAFTAPFRNNSSWTAFNESTRFVPSGIVWYEGGYPGGTIVGHGKKLNITPTVTTTYTVVIKTCSGGTATPEDVVVTVIPKPTANAGSDIPVCSAGNNVPINATAVNSGLITWETTSVSGGYFNNFHIEDPIYYPSVGDITLGNVTLKMIVDGYSACSTYKATDDLLLTLAETPTAYAGPDGYVCSNGTYQLNGTYTGAIKPVWTRIGNGGNFSNKNIPNPIYTPNTADSINGGVDLVITSDGQGPCLGVSASDAVHLTIVNAPLANAGPDFFSCIGNNILILGASAENKQSLFWTKSGTGTFIGLDSTRLDPGYIPSAADILAGSVTFTLHLVPNSPCDTVIDQLKVTFTAPPSADAGPAQTICANSPVALVSATASEYSNIVWTSSSGHPGFDDPNAEKPIYTPSTTDTAAHTVTLTMTANGHSPCAPAISTVVITINPEPHAFAGPGAIVCQPDPYELAFSTVAGAPSFTWSSPTLPSGFSSLTTLHPIYTPNATDIANGSVTLTLTANPFASCAAVANDMVLLITKKPLASAGPAQTICANSSVTLASASASEYSSIVWTSSSGHPGFDDPHAEKPIYTPSTTDTAAHTVTLTMTANGHSPCAPAISTVVITINPEPHAFAGPGAIVCQPDPYALDFSTVAGAQSFTWSSTTLPSGFSSLTTLHPIYTPNATDIANGSVTLTLTANPFTSCAAVANGMVLLITKKPLASAGPAQTICANSSVTLASASASEYSSIVWTSSSGHPGFDDPHAEKPIYTPSTTDTAAHTVTLTMTANGHSPCAPAISTVVITINPEPHAFAGSDATICQTGKYILSSSTYAGATSLTWFSPTGGSFIPAGSLHPEYTPTPTDITAGSVILTLTANPYTSCAAVQDAMVLHITRQPTAYAGANHSICQNVTYTIPDA